MAASSGTAKRIEVDRFEEFLDRAVDEVFSTMVGVHCAPTGIGERFRRSLGWPAG